jgi:hypothetical protein
MGELALGGNGDDLIEGDVEDGGEDTIETSLVVARLKRRLDLGDATAASSGRMLFLVSIPLTFTQRTFAAVINSVGEVARGFRSSPRSRSRCVISNGGLDTILRSKSHSPITLPSSSYNIPK